MKTVVKRIDRIVPAAFLVGVLAACSPKESVPELPADWRSWKAVTDRPLDYPIPGHEDSFRIPRMNGVGYASVPRADADGKRHWDFAEGTVIAKEIYAGSKPALGAAPVGAAVMVKAPRDRRARGGWLWISKDLATGRSSVITTPFCVTCHANANETHPYGDRNPRGEFRDFVFIVP